MDLGTGTGGTGKSGLEIPTWFVLHCNCVESSSGCEQFESALVLNGAQ